MKPVPNLNLSYEKQIQMKSEKIKAILDEAFGKCAQYTVHDSYGNCLLKCKRKSIRI